MFISALLFSAIVSSVHVGPYLQSVTKNSSWVKWETTQPLPSIVYYGNSLSLKNSAIGVRRKGKTVDGTTKTWVHEVELQNLAPASYYFYSLEKKPATENIFRFRTPPQNSQLPSFSFLVYADIQAKPDKIHTAISNEVTEIMKEEYGGTPEEQLAFALIAGDLVNNGNNYDEFKKIFFDPIRSLAGHFPFYPAIGNHEKNNSIYFQYFHLPENGTPGFIEHWYSFEYANTHIISLDTNKAYRIDEQLQWLDYDLTKACLRPYVDFIFLVFHHPYISELNIDDEVPFSGKITHKVEAKLQECGKAGALFYGHTHAYARGQSKDVPLYWVSAASGGGAIDYWGRDKTRDYKNIQKSFDEYGYLIIDVTTGQDAGFRGRRFSLGDDFITKKRNVQDLFYYRKNNEPPDSPTLLQSRTSPLLATAYHDSDGDLHLETDWQLWSPQGPMKTFWFRYENWYNPFDGNNRDWKQGPLRDIDTNAGYDLTTLKVPSNYIGRGLFWHVRYRDAGLIWSDWSE
ncbi:MAG: metallophosphoesterase family protein [Deltaproteobacteria bacterium]|nr:metallophosphoesterase family protein [Deltaproteobacteria bacterium]